MPNIETRTSTPNQSLVELYKECLNNSEQNWERYRRFFKYSISGYCLSAALSIALSQVFVLLCLAFWIFCLAAGKGRSEQRLLPQLGSKLSLIISLWLIIALLASFFGPSASRSLPEFFKTSLYLLFPFVVFDALPQKTNELLNDIKYYFRLLFIGFSFSSIHSLLAVAAPAIKLPRTPGPVTESGQLVLIIPIFIFILLLELQGKDKRKLLSKKFILLSAIGVLLFSTLVLNLKRGPWMAVLAELSLLGVLVSPQILFSAVGGAMLLLLIAPARERIFSLVDHFMIFGGRLAMWTLGIEIAARFPLGLGFENAEFMRLLDPTIPETHRHMHSNILNVVVETGWIGLAIFIWWMFTLLKTAFEHWKTRKCSASTESYHLALCSLCIGISLLGWQIAGLVEYNLGDGEIRMIALFLMGILIAADSHMGSLQSSRRT